jgi:hypothetical protein
LLVDPTTAADFLSRAGVVGALLIAMWAGATRRWVWGYQLEEMRQDRDMWRDLALRSIGQTSRTVDVVQKGVNLVERNLG